MIADTHPALEPLSPAELLELSGGSILKTGSPELANDIGNAVGAVVGVLALIGRSFYESGGLTGTNPLLTRRRC